MRILRIRFRNLNSLIGEWEIDLTHQAFASDGIFVITGPTGAGKTTILDAVCLALYGRTPRLGRITKSGNEIMSRQTGECSAEVSFETEAFKALASAISPSKPTAARLVWKAGKAMAATSGSPCLRQRPANLTGHRRS